MPTTTVAAFFLESMDPPLLPMELGLSRGVAPKGFSSDKVENPKENGMICDIRYCGDKGMVNLNIDDEIIVLCIHHDKFMMTFV